MGRGLLFVVLLLSSCRWVEFDHEELCHEIGFAVANRTLQCTGDAALGDQRYDTLFRDHQCNAKTFYDQEFDAMLACAQAARLAPCNAVAGKGDELEWWMSLEPGCNWAFVPGSRNWDPDGPPDPGDPEPEPDPDWDGYTCDEDDEGWPTRAGTCVDPYVIDFRGAAAGVDQVHVPDWPYVNIPCMTSWCYEGNDVDTAIDIVYEVRTDAASTVTVTVLSASTNGLIVTTSDRNSCGDVPECGPTLRNNESTDFVTDAGTQKAMVYLQSGTDPGVTWTMRFSQVVQ